MAVLRAYAIITGLVVLFGVTATGSFDLHLVLSLTAACVFCCAVASGWAYLKRTGVVTGRRIKIFWAMLLMPPLIFIAAFTLRVMLWPLLHQTPDLQTVTAESFRFTHYTENQRQALIDSLDKILPLGLPKADVERIFVERAGAVARNHPQKKGVVIYSHEAPAILRCGGRKYGMTDPVWNILVEYDAEQKLLSFDLPQGLGCGL